MASFLEALVPTLREAGSGVCVWVSWGIGEPVKVAEPLPSVRPSVLLLEAVPESSLFPSPNTF